MKVSFFSFPNLAYGGGFERYIMKLATEFTSRGHNVSIVTADRKVQGWLEFMLSLYYLKPRLSFRDKFRISSDEIKRNLRNIALYEVSSLKDMKQHLDEADIIYAKNEILDLSVLKILSFMCGDLPPVLCGIHTPIFYPFTRSLQSKCHNLLYLSGGYRHLLSICSGFHVLNSDDAKIIDKYFPRERKIYYVPHFIDGEESKKIRKTAPNFNILFVGRLDTEQKGVDILLNIVKFLNRKSEFTDINFTIIGSGELAPKIVELSGLYSNVHYKGYVDWRKLQESYLSHDISLVLSRWETFSYVCLESQYYGLPVIASDIPGPRDIITKGETGFIVNPENINEILTAILRLYHLKKNSPREFEIIKKKIKKKTIFRYSKTVIIPKLEGMFKEVSALKRTSNN